MTLNNILTALSCGCLWEIEMMSHHKVNLVLEYSAQRQRELVRRNIVSYSGWPQQSQLDDPTHRIPPKKAFQEWVRLACYQESQFGDWALLVSKVKVWKLVPQSCLTLQSHGLQPTRLLCPWNSPGKNTEVGCHSLLRGIFLTQRSRLLHGRQIQYQLSHETRRTSPL